MTISTPPAADDLPPNPAPAITEDAFAAGSENRLRHACLRVAQWLFSPPFLPGWLVLFTSLVQISVGLFTLMEQPPHYWASGEFPTNNVYFGDLLKSGPLAYLAAVLVYALLSSIVLSVLNRRAALVVWIVLGWLAMVDFTYLGWCGFNNLSQFSGRYPNCARSQVLALLGFTAVWGLAFGGTLVLIHRQDEQPKPARPPLAIRAVLLILAAWILFSGGMAIRGAAAPRPTWQQIQTAHAPSPRDFVTIAYDTQHGQAVLFGGSDSWSSDSRWIGKADTWVWDGQDWIEMHPAVQPSARLGSAIAYDEKRGVTVLFGGADLDVGMNDTWVWDGSTWTRMNPPVSPPPRRTAAMAYDPRRQKIVLFGGYAPNQTPPDMQDIFYKDAWEWDGQTWTEIPMSESHPIVSFAMVANPFQDGMIVFSNEGQWDLVDGHFRPSRPDFLPPGGYDANLVYEPQRKSVFLFGGSRLEKDTNETWQYDGTLWKRIFTSESPPARGELGLFYDSKRGRILLFGGYDGKTFYNDTWELVIP